VTEAAFGPAWDPKLVKVYPSWGVVEPQFIGPVERDQAVVLQPAESGHALCAGVVGDSKQE
jgi:hypothetical protein